MGLFGPPNVAKLAVKGDLTGLVSAAYYKKDAEVRATAREVLKAYIPEMLRLLDQSYESLPRQRVIQHGLAACGEEALDPLVRAYLKSNSHLDNRVQWGYEGVLTRMAGIDGRLQTWLRSGTPRMVELATDALDVRRARPELIDVG